jgi:DUF438 domain-containing protein
MKRENVKAQRQRPASSKMLQLGAGKVSIEEIEALLDTLPFTVDFVDKEDNVRYFNMPKNRIFPRTGAEFNTKVQDCHPEESVPLVNKILKGFKSGKMEVSESRVRREGRLIQIRYFAVRSRDGEYLGALEVAQDVTAIRKRRSTP